MQDGYQIKFNESFLYGNHKDIFIVAHSHEEIQEFQNKYFSVSYLNNISSNFFEDNLMAFALIHYTGSMGYLKNERIEEINDKYTFIAELWKTPPSNYSSPVAGAFLALYTKAAKKLKNNEVYHVLGDVKIVCA